MIDDAELPALARSLRRIEPTALKRRLDGHTTHWFRGNEPYFEIVFETDVAGDLVWFQFTLRGHALTWELPNRLRTGRTNELEHRGNDQPSSKLIIDSTDIDESLVRLVRRVLEEKGEPLFAAALAVLTRP